MSLSSRLRNLVSNRKVLVDSCHFFCKSGEFGTLDFRIDYYGKVYANVEDESRCAEARGIETQGADYQWNRISPWHHVPLFQYDSPKGTVRIIERNEGSIQSSFPKGQRISDKIVDGIDSRCIASCRQGLSTKLAQNQIDQNDLENNETGDEKTPKQDRIDEIDGILIRPIERVEASFLSMSNILINMVVEIPKFTKQKMEIATNREGNPIIQDTKSGQPRLYSAPMYWNYGALPQTWESPNVRGGPEVFCCQGDNDPLDVIEVGETPLPMGEIVPVRVLGSLALIDQGELDWKILAIRAEDPRSEIHFRDVRDIEDLFPKVMGGIKEWLRWYKVPDGKPLNRFGYEEQWMTLEDTCKIVADGHAEWMTLLNINGHAETDRNIDTIWRPKFNSIADARTFELASDNSGNSWRPSVGKK